MRPFLALLVGLLTCPLPTAHSVSQTVTAERPMVVKYGQAGGYLVFVSCSVQSFPAAAQTTSTCSVNGDTEKWVMVNGIRAHRTSPQSFSGKVAVSQWLDDLEGPGVATACAGGSAIFNVGLSGTTTVHATPVCTTIDLV